jgi:ankyrin repeat protein
MPDQAESTESLHLFSAIRAGDAAGVRAALAGGSSVGGCDAHGHTPLRAAIVGGDVGIVRLILEAGADPNRPEVTGELPLTLAARLDAPVLQRLDQRGGVVEAGRYAPLLVVLVQHGADLRAAGPEAARYAVLNASLDTLHTLDQLGLGWAAPDPHADQPDVPLSASLLALAIHQGAAADIVRFLCQRQGSGVRGATGAALVRRWAERPGELDHAVLEVLLEAGAPAEGPDEVGVTPLMLAAARGSAPAVARLLSAGADPAARDHQGRAVLDHAAAANDLSALALLRGRAKGGERQAGQAATFAVDRRIICQPWGEPPVLRCEGSAESLAAALAFVEQRWSGSRARIGPFPVLRVVHPDGAERGSNPLATQAAARVIVGDFLLLTLIAPRSMARRNRWSPEEPQGERLVVGAVCASRSQALAALGRATGWSVVVEVEALPQMEDGYPLAADAWQVGPFPAA